MDLWASTRMQATAGLLGRGAPPQPCPGSWQDQPAALVDAFAILDRLTSEER